MTRAAILRIYARTADRLLVEQGHEVGGVEWVAGCLHAHCGTCGASLLIGDDGKVSGAAMDGECEASIWD